MRKSFRVKISKIVCVCGHVENESSEDLTRDFTRSIMWECPKCKRLYSIDMEE